MPELEMKFDILNSPGLSILEGTFRESYFLLCNNDDEKCNKLHSKTKLMTCMGAYFSKEIIHESHGRNDKLNSLLLSSL